MPRSRHYATQMQLTGGKAKASDVFPGVKGASTMIGSEKMAPKPPKAKKVTHLGR